MGRTAMLVVVNSCHSMGLTSKDCCRARRRPARRDHFPSSDRSEDRYAKDRFQSGAARFDGRSKVLLLQSRRSRSCGACRQPM